VATGKLFSQPKKQHFGCALGTGFVGEQVAGGLLLLRLLSAKM
jgi:hypothetical protein